MANFRARLTLTRVHPFGFGRRRRRRRRHHRRRHHRHRRRRRRLVSSVPTPGRSELLPCRPTGLPGLFAFAKRAGARFDPLSSLNKATPTLHLHKIARRSHLSGNNRSLSRDLSRDQWRPFDSREYHSLT